MFEISVVDLSIIDQNYHWNGYRWG